jgi:hypothetical protein
MDVSSKYFPLLSRPGPYELRHIWQFLLDSHRAGKLRELVSFIGWEIMHRLRFFRIEKRYISFTEHRGLAITSEGIENGVSNSSIPEHGLRFQPVPIDWKFCIETVNGTLWGCCYSQTNVLFCSHDQSQSARLVYTFDYPITSLFISPKHGLFVCANGVVYKSIDQGLSFSIALQLSTPSSYFLFNNGMTELPDQTLLIGEYGSIWHGDAWQNLAYLYYSSDGGTNWNTTDFLMRQGVNKHIHLVKYSPRLQAIFLTDGDNKKQLWINKQLNCFNQQPDDQTSGWHLINKRHYQTGGYLSMAETAEAVLFGSDYLGGTNFIVRTADGQQFSKKMLPDPYRRSPVINMVTRHSRSGNEIWVVSYSCLGGNTRSLLMCSKDSGRSWARVIEFDGAKHEVRLVSSSLKPTDTLYISVTEFGSQPDQHRHWVYRVKSA